MTTPLDAPYVDQVMMPDLNDPPAKCCDTGWCGECGECGDWLSTRAGHTHRPEMKLLNELVVVTR